MVKISPSILSANFACLQSELKKVEGAEWIHIDVMDGRFVPSITIGPLVVKALRKITQQVLDVHLMIEHPEKHVAAFAEAGADIIVVHAEACKDLGAVLEQIKGLGCKAGVSIKPGTDVSEIEHVLHMADVVLVMTVEPGFGGQKFMPHALSKVTKLKEIALQKNLSFEVEVDGGINKDNCAAVAGAGADVLVAGSAIFYSQDPAAMLRTIREKADASA
ncbi:MAG: ribulose-phosphate 3-epimerase [Candidatus Aenigmarchaeota archaeon]|nr:ribulose-phosphate 3-epimerase [Candidatus Aenigmarchaeota archaeon]